MIYTNPDLKLVASSLDGAAFTFPTYTAGETIRFGLRFFRAGPDGSNDLYDPDLRSLTASISLVDARPSAGSTAYKIGPGPATDANTTTSLPHNHNARALQDAINALAAVVTMYGLCTVDPVPGGFVVVFASATGAVPITSARNRLSPLSLLRHIAYEIDDVWHNEIRWIQAPLETTSAWPRVLPTAPVIVAHTEGGLDESGQFPTLEVQKLILNPEYRGLYQIRRPDNMARTKLLSFADGPAAVQEALQVIYRGQGTIRVEPGQNFGLIEFGGDLAGIDVPLLEVVPGDAPPGDPTITLSLDRPAVYAALRSSEKVDAVLEIRARIAPPGADEAHAGNPVVVLHRKISIARGVNFDALAASVPPPWLRPPNPANYIPSTDDQIFVGGAGWDGPIGDGVNTVIVIDHNLGTDKIASLVVRPNVAGAAALVHGVDYEWEPTGEDSVTITLATPAAEDGLYAVISAAGQVSNWAPHTHTKDQIVDLVDDLEELFGRVQELESYVPSTTPGVPATSGPGLTVELPLLREVLFLNDGSKLPKEGLPELPCRAPALLPAIHDGTLDTLPLDPLPTPTGNAGKVYNHTGESPVTLPSFGILPSRQVPSDGTVGCDGRALYEVSRWQDTNSYYAAAYDASLWDVAINDKMLPPGATLHTEFALRLALLGANCKAQWVLVIEQGTSPAETDPDPVGLNLESVDWNPEPILMQRMILTPLLQTHVFGVRIRRSATELLLDKRVYRDWVTGTAPASANFVLRARLIKFDTPNSVPDAAGWVFYNLSGIGSGAEPATLTIT